MHAEALEIFLGLVYLDYTDDPDKEAHPEGVTRRQSSAPGV
jgi:hypothetical protein